MQEQLAQVRQPVGEFEAHSILRAGAAGAPPWLRTVPKGKELNRCHIDLASPPPWIAGPQAVGSRVGRFNVGSRERAAAGRAVR